MDILVEYALYIPEYIAHILLHKLQSKLCLHSVQAASFRRDFRFEV